MPPTAARSCRCAPFLHPSRGGVRPSPTAPRAPSRSTTTLAATSSTRERRHRVRPCGGVGGAARQTSSQLR
eukprot:5142848-Prymnesium_polylepis.2